MTCKEHAAARAMEAARTKEDASRLRPELVARTKESARSRFWLRSAFALRSLVLLAIVFCTYEARERTLAIEAETAQLEAQAARLHPHASMCWQTSGLSAASVFATDIKCDVLFVQAMATCAASSRDGDSAAFGIADGHTLSLVGLTVGHAYDVLCVPEAPPLAPNHSEPSIGIGAQASGNISLSDATASATVPTLIPNRGRTITSTGTILVGSGGVNSAEIRGNQ